MDLKYDTMEVLWLFAPLVRGFSRQELFLAKSEGLVIQHVGSLPLGATVYEMHLNFSSLSYQCSEDEVMKFTFEPF